MYPAGATIGNGQLIIHILPALLAGIFLLQQNNITWQRDVLASILFLASLAKPTISAPFFWLILMLPGRLRPALLIISGYAGLTFFAASFQEEGVLRLVEKWLALGSKLANKGVGYGNVHGGLAALGLASLVVAVTLLLILLAGLWIARHRHVDLWVLLGVTAIVTRLCAYHRWYDDLLILLPMIALFRLTKRAELFTGSAVLAGALLGINLLTMLAPGGKYLFPPPWSRMYTAIQLLVWMMTLLFLLICAQYWPTGKSAMDREPKRA
jgi:hypothetical protein